MTDGYYTGGVSSSSVLRKESGSAGASSVTKPLPYPKMELVEEELGDEDFAFSDQEQKGKNDLKPIPGSDLSVKEEMDDDESLTSWFRPIFAKQDGNKKQLSSISTQIRKPPTDRPILGTVTAHWNDDQTPKDPPKWWDGNGIPNSTNKCKEDQKVSWFATPFEEGLEKGIV